MLNVTKVFSVFQANLVIQERRLGVAMTDLAEAQKTLDEKQAELDAVQATYDAAMKSKQVLLFLTIESFTSKIF